MVLFRQFETFHSDYQKRGQKLCKNWFPIIKNCKFTNKNRKNIEKK